MEDLRQLRQQAAATRLARTTTTRGWAWIIELMIFSVITLSRKPGCSFHTMILVGSGDLAEPTSAFGGRREGSALTSRRAGYCGRASFLG